MADNIRFGRPEATRQEVEAAARAIGAEPVILELPDGYDTEVGERGALLSAGQRQLVAFARAWLADPALLILDEATSSLDVATETRVTEAMRRLRQGRTTIVIAHRLSTVIEADQIAVIEDGRVVEPVHPTSCSPAAASCRPLRPLARRRRMTGLDAAACSRQEAGPERHGRRQLARGQLASRVRLAGEDGPPVADAGMCGSIPPGRGSIHRGGARDLRLQPAADDRDHRQLEPAGWRAAPAQDPEPAPSGCCPPPPPLLQGQVG